MRVVDIWERALCGEGSNSFNKEAGIRVVVGQLDMANIGLAECFVSRNL